MLYNLIKRGQEIENPVMVMQEMKSKLGATPICFLSYRRSTWSNRKIWFMILPVKIENDSVVILNEKGKIEHEDFVETLIFLDEIFSSYNNKKLIIIDPGSDYSPSIEESQEFLNLIWLLLENTFSRIALVVSKNFHFGIGKMTEAFSEASTGWFRVFLNEQNAREWLSN